MSSLRSRMCDSRLPSGIGKHELQTANSSLNVSRVGCGPGEGTVPY
jgi:hypothetical protein